MLRKIKNALISVSDKSDLEKILFYLKKYKVKIISSGGTFREIIKSPFTLGRAARENTFTALSSLTLELDNSSGFPNDDVADSATYYVEITTTTTHEFKETNEPVKLSGLEFTCSGSLNVLVLSEL